MGHLSRLGHGRRESLLNGTPFPYMFRNLTQSTVRYGARLCENICGSRRKRCVNCRLGELKKGLQPDQSCFQPLDSHDVNHSFQIVGENMQAHLRSHAWKRLGKKMRRPHPRFKCAEWVLYRTPPHSGGVSPLGQSLMHAIKGVFMLPTRDSSIDAE